MGLELDQLELLPHQLAPVRKLSATEHGDDDDDDGCATPTSEANVLRAPSLCPPAPRKPRPARAKRRQQQHRCYYRGRWRRCSSGPAQVRYWVVAVPGDLAAVFVARRPSSPSSSSSLCRPPAGRKIRVHVVG